MSGMRYQPQGLVRLSPSNSLNRDIIAFPLSTNPYSMGTVPGIKTNIPSAVSVQATPVGKSLAFSTSAPSFVTLGSIPQMTTTAFTAAMVARIDAIPTSGNALTLFESGAATDGSFQASNGSCQFRVNPSGGFDILRDNQALLGSSPNNVVTPGVMFTVAISYASDGTTRIALNGVVIAQFSGASTFRSGNFSLFTKDGTASEKGAGAVALFVYWPRALSQMDMVSVTANPWQIFEASDDQDTPLVSTNSYTYIGSGGFNVAGIGQKLGTKLITPAGVITYSGAASTTYNRGSASLVVNPTGLNALVFGGTDVVTRSTNKTTLGGVSLGGTSGASGSGPVVGGTKNFKRSLRPRFHT